MEWGQAERTPKRYALEEVELLESLAPQSMRSLVAALRSAADAEDFSFMGEILYSYLDNYEGSHEDPEFVVIDSLYAKVTKL